MNFKNGFYDGISNEDYHSSDRLGASKCKTLLDNPYLFLNPPERVETTAFNLGSAVHSLVLEPHKFESEFVIAPQVDKRTKVGKATWAEFIEASEGKTVLTADEGDMAREMAQNVLNSRAGVLLENAQYKEWSAFSEIDGKEVQCRPDAYSESLGIVFDLKTTDDAKPASFAKSVAKFGYHLQHAFYQDVMTSLDKPAHRFIFIVVSKKAPYMVSVNELTQESVDLGRERYKKAFAIHDKIDEYKEPIFRADDGEYINMISLPAWAFYE